MSLGHPTLGQVLAYIDRFSLDLEPRGPVTFSWPAAHLDGLVGRLDMLIESREIHKFGYDYATEIVSFDTMGENDLHQQVQRRLDHHLCSAIQNLAATIDHGIQGRLRNVWGSSTAQTVLPGVLDACPDIAFKEQIILNPSVLPLLPSLVCEIS